ncbi:MAG TPA: biopolymer transporter ExbD [Lacipirellula sp.]
MGFVSTDVDVLDEVEAPIYARDREVIDAEMDITPMIDCVFLLLIFFIVCSTMDDQSPIDLADARHGKAVGERESVIISIGEGGVDSAPVYLSDTTTGDPLPTDPDQQRERIVSFVQDEQRSQAKNDVLIKADRNVAHRDVAQVIKAVSQVEGVNIHLAVTESE